MQAKVYRYYVEDADGNRYADTTTSFLGVATALAKALRGDVVREEFEWCGAELVASFTGGEEKNPLTSIHDPAILEE